MADAADPELPKAVIKRLVKAKLSEKSEGADDAKRDFQINKDALSAFSQATKVFISYVACAAHDICKENKRSTVAANDVVKALEELEFEGFLPELATLLTRIQQTKRKAPKDDDKEAKRKSSAAEASTVGASGGAGAQTGGLSGEPANAPGGDAGGDAGGGFEEMDTEEGGGALEEDTT